MDDNATPELTAVQKLMKKIADNKGTIIKVAAVAVGVAVVGGITLAVIKANQAAEAERAYLENEEMILLEDEALNEE